MKWSIVKLEHNPFDNEHSPTDENALWEYQLSMEGSTCITGSGFDFRDVKLLMKHFGVSDWESVVGQVFDSPRQEPIPALYLLLTEIKNGGKYTPPSSEEVRRIAAAALAKFELPDYSLLDPDDVAKAFSEGWEMFRAKESWLKDFAKEINDLSDSKHKVRLLPATINDVFKFRVRGPAEYMLLKRGRKTQRVVIGPYSNPIHFD